MDISKLTDEEIVKTRREFDALALKLGIHTEQPIADRGTRAGQGDGVAVERSVPQQLAPLSVGPVELNALIDGRISEARREQRRFFKRVRPYFFGFYDGEIAALVWLKKELGLKAPLGPAESDQDHAPR